jgi:putative oxidoreductase
MTGFDPAIEAPIDLLRLACGLFFLPHILAKIFNRPVTLGFFEAAGFRPAATAMAFALAIELAVAFAFIAGFRVDLAGWLGAAFLTVAALAVAKVSRGKWLWNLGGAEYCVFWAIACVVVALEG